MSAQSNEIAINLLYLLLKVASSLSRYLRVACLLRYCIALHSSCWCKTTVSLPFAFYFYIFLIVEPRQISLSSELHKSLI